MSIILLNELNLGLVNFSQFRLPRGKFDLSDVENFGVDLILTQLPGLHFFIELGKRMGLFLLGGGEPVGSLIVIFRSIGRGLEGAGNRVRGHHVLQGTVVDFGVILVGSPLSLDDVASVTAQFLHFLDPINVEELELQQLRLVVSDHPDLVLADLVDHEHADLLEVFRENPQVFPYFFFENFPFDRNPFLLDFLTREGNLVLDYPLEHLLYRVQQPLLVQLRYYKLHVLVQEQFLSHQFQCASINHIFLHYYCY